MTDLLTLGDLLADYETARTGERDGRGHSGATASALGGCPRRLAYQANGTPPSDDRPPVTVATVGSLLHDAVGLLWQARGRPVEVTGTHGTCDVIDDTRIRDLKTLSRSRFDAWDRSGGPPMSVWQQLHIYGHDQGADAHTDLVVDALCRETGRTATYTMRFDREVASRALADLAVLDTLAALDPDEVPIGGDRHGYGDPICGNCPWLALCWGEPEDHGVTDPTEVERYALEYLDAAAAEREARQRKDVARSRLAAASGTYGTVTVRWTEQAGRHVEYDTGPSRRLTVGLVQ